MKEADVTRVHNSFDITKLTNEWGQKSTKMYNNLSRLTRIFEKEKIIDSQQSEMFQSRRNEIEDNLKNAKTEVEDNLKDISAEGLEELKKSINEKYSNNAKH